MNTDFNQYLQLRKNLNNEDYEDEEYIGMPKHLIIEINEKKLMRYKYRLLRKCNYVSKENDVDFEKFRNFRNDDSSAHETNLKIMSNL